MPDTAGQKANQTGSNLEGFIRSQLKRAGYDQVEPRHFKAAQCLHQPIFAEQYLCGKDIYGKPRKCDFILFRPAREQPNLIIECKWQQPSGSVDEKFPFLVNTIESSGIDSIVVLDGGGFSEGAARWLRKRAGAGHLLHVFDMSQFQTFANDGNL